MIEKYLPKEVIAACGFLPNIRLLNEDLRFPIFYNQVIAGSGLERYARLMYRNGAYQSMTYNEFISKRNSGEFKAQDDAFQEWESRCLQMKEIFSLDEESLQLFYSNGKQKRTQITSLSSQALSTIVDMQLESLGEFENEIFTEKNIFPYVSIIKAEVIDPHPLCDLNSIEERLKFIDRENKKIYEGKNRKVNDPLKTKLHLFSQQLALIIKADRFLLGDYDSIDKVKMVKEDYQVIHNFLTFFKLDPPTASGDNSTTNTDLIKTMLKQFPKNESFFLGQLNDFKQNLKRLKKECANTEIVKPKIFADDRE